MSDDAIKQPAAVDDLIEDLADGGTVDSRGAFTLDTEVARKKMAQFQLAEPHDYVLLLVQAAVRQGASQLAVQVEEHALEVQLDGRPFTRADLERIWIAQFDPSHRAGERHGLHELAVALCSAQALEADEIEVRSGDGETAVALEVRLDGTDRVVPLQEEDALRGTRITLTQRGLDKYRGAALGGDEVYERLERRCGHAPLALEVNATPLRTAPLPDHAVATVGVDAGPLHVDAGFTAGRYHHAELRVVKDGVWVQTQALEKPAPGFVAVLQGDTLRTDLSRFHVVEDEAWRRGLDAVRQALEDATLALRHLSRATSPEARYPLGWRQQVLRRILTAYEDRELLFGEEADAVAQALRDTPLFVAVKTAHTEVGSVSLQTLFRHVEGGGRVLYLDHTGDELRPEWQGVLAPLAERYILQSSDPQTLLWLRDLLGEGFGSLASVHPTPFAKVLRPTEDPAVAADQQLRVTRNLIALVVLVVACAAVLFTLLLLR